MNPKQFDELFEQVFEEAVKKNASLTPDPAVSWLKVQRKIDRMAKRKRMMQRTAIACCLITAVMLGGLLFSLPHVSKAFQPFFHGMVEIQKEVVTLVFRTLQSGDEAKTPPPSSNGSSADIKERKDVAIPDRIYPRETASIVQAEIYTTFAMPQLTYIPDNYQLESIRLYYEDSSQDLANRAVLLFKSEQDSFRITAQSLGGNTVISAAVDKESREVETVSIQSHTGYLIESNQGRVYLEFLFYNLHISITGNLDREETLAIARGMK